MGACCEPNESTFFISSDGDIHKTIPEDQNEFGLLQKNASTDRYPSSTSTYMNDNQEITQMEEELFNLINSLRQNPQQFINLIEKYKNSILYDNEKGSYFIIINNSRIDLNHGKEYFIECQNFLKTATPQNILIKDNKLKLPRPSQILNEEQNDDYVNRYINNYIIANPSNKYSNIKYITDINVSDILFVLILNLIGVGDYEQIRKNFVLSEDFNSVGITIDKIDPQNDIYCYYCIFGKANNV